MSRLWDTLIRLPHVPVAAYLALVGWGGVVSGGITPDSLHVLPAWLVEMWTFAVAIGGTGSVIGALMQRTRIESTGLGLLAYGSVLYGLVGAVVLWPGSATVIALSAAVASMCLIRMRVLSLARHAQEVATARLGEHRTEDEQEEH